jgi:methylenetetrahydrofolate dehydrogenase (NADP+) / methenyltetrahydrofolate cyclohydrolase
VSELATILNGKKIADEMLQSLKSKIINLNQKFNLFPGLAIIQVGDNDASNIYINNKIISCDLVGIKHFYYKIPVEVTEEDLLEKIAILNNDNAINGIIVQLPLPKNISVKKIVNAIDPAKDVDGFHPINMGNLALGYQGLVPCTPQGCMKLIKLYCNDIAGKHAVVIGRSNIVGKPMSLLFNQENCTVSSINSYTKNPQQICKNADIIVVAAGVKHLVNKEWVKQGAIVIDVGINVFKNIDGNRQLSGDVDFADIQNIASAISPVPGGVGPLTVAFLMQNTLLATCYKYLVNFEEL